MFKELVMKWKLSRLRKQQAKEIAEWNARVEAKRKAKQAAKAEAGR